MNTATLDISEAQKKLAKIDERLSQDRVIWVTRHNKRAFAIVDADFLESTFETMEILSDPDASSMLRKSLEDIRCGRLHEHEDVRENSQTMPARDDRVG